MWSSRFPLARRSRGATQCARRKPRRPRPWLAVILLLAGCTGGGGGGGSAPTIPIAPWGGFRRDVANSGGAIGSLRENPGTIRASFEIGQVTLSSPALGVEEAVYIGTGAGLLALRDDGDSLAVLWRFEGYTRQCSGAGTACASDSDCLSGETCRCAACTPGLQGCTPVGSVNSSPTVTNEADVVFASSAGRVFALHDPGTEPADCKWVFPAPEDDPLPFGLESSPAVTTDVFDASLSAIVIGTNDGHTLTLNGNGTPRWVFPENGSTLGTLNSSPAIGSGGTVFATAPNGFLYALGATGKLKWRFPWDVDPAAADLLPSPVVSLSVYIAGSTAITAVYPDGTLKWQANTDKPLRTSPAVVSQLISLVEEGQNGGDSAQATPTATLGTTPEATPTPTPGDVTAFELVVFAVDDSGTLYGIRDATGQLLKVRDISGTVREAKLVLDVPASGVSSSPAISADGYVVYGTDDGVLYARRLDGAIPCDARCSDSERPCFTDEDCAAGATCDTADACVSSRWGSCSLQHCAGNEVTTCSADQDCEDAGTTGPCETSFCRSDGACPLADEGETCSREGSIRIGGRIRSSPVIDDDGNIYVSAEDGFLYVIGAPPTP